METKNCIRCGIEYKRAKKLSESQWQSRKFCSKRCSAIKHEVDVDGIMSMYFDEKKSSSEIGEKIGISSVHVLRIIKQNGGGSRNLKEAISLSHSRGWVRDKIRLSSLGRKHSDKAKEKLRMLYGENSGTWTGGLSISAGGYIVFTGSRANGVHANKALHVVIAEWLYQRKIGSNEHVHHIDGDKLNNNPENLCIISDSEHMKLHQEARK